MWCAALLKVHGLGMRGFERKFRTDLDKALFKVWSTTSERMCEKNAFSEETLERNHPTSSTTLANPI